MNAHPWYVRYSSQLRGGAIVSVLIFLLVPGWRFLPFLYLLAYGLGYVVLYTQWLPVEITTPIRAVLGAPSTAALVPIASTPTQSTNTSLQSHSATSYSIRIPKGADFQPARAIAFVEAILTVCGEALFTIVFEDDRVEWRVIDTGKTWENPDAIAATIRRMYPQAEVSTVPYVEPTLSRPYNRVVVPIQCQGQAYRPIKLPAALKEHDPLAALTNILALAERDERVMFAIYMGEHPNQEEYKALWMDITQSQVGWGQAVPTQSRTAEHAVGYAIGSMVSIFRQKQREQSDPTRRAPKYEPEAQKIFEQKLSQPLYHALMYLQFDFPQGTGVEKFASLFATIQEFGSDYQLIDFDQPHTRTLTLTPDQPQEASASSIYGQVQAVRQARAEAGAKRFGKGYTPPAHDTLLTTTELATLWHLPAKTFENEEIVWARSVVRMAETLTEATNALCVGTNTFAGTQRRAYLPYASRTTHMAIVGKTRMGKSTLMHNLIHQDIAAGHGVTVIDPQGQLTKDVLQSSIPPEREQDVVVLELSDEGYPIPLNLLAAPASLPTDTVIGQVYAVLERYGNFADTLTLRPALWQSLALLRHETAPTIRDVFRVLTDDTYRAQLLGKAEKSPVSQDYWAAFERKSVADRDRTTVGPLSERLAGFYASNHLYHMLCHPTSLDLTKLMADRKIILLSLADPASAYPDYQRQLLGGALVSQLLLAATARGTTGNPYFLYIDEVDAFLTSPLDTILSKAGKYNLSLTIASQYLAQLRGATLEAVMGNVSNWAVFRVGHDDAQQLATYLPGFTSDDLTAMPAHEAAALLQKGTDTYAFSLSTLPMPATPNANEAIDCEARIRRLSQKTYTPKTRAEVAEWLAKRYEIAPIAPLPKQPVDVDDFLEPAPASLPTPPKPPTRKRKTTS